MKFGLARLGDAAELAELRNRVAERLTADFGGGHWSSMCTEQGVAQGIRSSRVLVARRGKTIVATLRLTTRKPWAIDRKYFAPSKRPIYLVDMAVDPRLQRRGVGRALLEEAKARARAGPGDSLRLDAYDAMAGAGEFYRKCGFREVGRGAYRATPLVYFEYLLENPERPLQQRRCRPRLRLRWLTLLLISATAPLAGCGPSPTPAAAPVNAAGSADRYSPSRDLGSLFQAVQLSAIFPDSKTFVDAELRDPAATVVARYDASRTQQGFDLQAFVSRQFVLPPTPTDSFRSDTSRTMAAHIQALWPVLTRGPPADPAFLVARSSLVPLPNAYVVPGGRFREVYYWDSYFTMLGLVQSGRIDMVGQMLDNFAYLIHAVGHIPNGNRTYYLSRSQPPFFGAMVALYAEATDTARALRYLPPLEAEHAFWMEGAASLAPGTAHRRVVRLPDGSLLNRYWDDLATPRPESYREDYTTGQGLAAGRRSAFYRNLRATAESGWDFSSRWMRDPGDLTSLETTELAPVDLNSLLYASEELISVLHRFRGASGDAAIAEQYARAAATRRQALLRAGYQADSGYFYDVRWRTGVRVVDRPTLAAVYPLYFGLATSEQSGAVADRLARDFLKPGGFVTTLVTSGQQWDAPNGWPPLEWLAIEGLRRYGRTGLADSARQRWLALNRRTFQATGKMVEKYDVVDLHRAAGGGEYPTQDGFGWTNGVALALLAALH